MLIAVDIGNSNVVLGIYQAATWTHTLRLESAREASALSFSLQIADYLLEQNLSAGQASGLIISSVVPDLTPLVRQACEQVFQRPATMLNAALYERLKLPILRPHEIGADLVANAVAAFDKYRQTCIIIDFGTALTFTTLNDQGSIVGVSIAPGLKTAIHALYQNTAQLPEVPLELPETVLGLNTTHAIQAGVMLGYVGMVEKMIERIRRELNRNCRVVVTGGLSFVMRPLAYLFDDIVPHLTLDGLRLLYEKSEQQPD
ncbi:type III pantothenate kinase [Eisenibacter elegans]|jgi:type III pantothenate kinase|uniref:type III pantothenate kinase n=1 Tax=Eisenibacter elegans TaxID=997 RepID=UPI000478D40F|nr:type III pantothenate kinase [Eisenibacter elegans]